MFDSLQRDGFFLSGELVSTPEQDVALSSIRPCDRSHDDGLTHNHGWASAGHGSSVSARSGTGPIVFDARSVNTPSCALHDDVHYAN